MRRFYVYGYFEPGSELPFYVGKGTGSRAWDHFRSYLLNGPTPFYKQLRELIANGQKPDVRLLEVDLSETEAFALEIELIAKYGRSDVETGCLSNCTDGGDGTSGYVHSEETKAKIGAANTGLERSFADRIKLSYAWHKNRKARIEAIRHSVTKTLGVSVCSYNLKTGETIKVYPSISSTRHDGFQYQNVYKVCRGQSQSHRGYGWKFC